MFDRHGRQCAYTTVVLFPEDGHSAVIRFTDAVCFLPDVQTLEVVVVQQMIAGVFEFVDSIKFNVAEWAHPGLVGTDSYQFFQGGGKPPHSKGGKPPHSEVPH